MRSFLLRRTGASLVLLLVLTAVVFVLEALVPGDPARASLGRNASDEAVAAQRERLGLDDPVVVQFGLYLWRLLHGDLGTSLRTHRTVVQDLSDFLPATVELVAASFVVAAVLGVVFAASGALRWPGTGVVRGLLLLGAAAPPFLLALGGLIWFYGDLGWLPASGRGAESSGPTRLLLVDVLLHGDLSLLGTVTAHLVMPALVLSIAPAVSIGRVLRSSLQGTLTADHVRTARSKGLTEVAVLARHVVRNSVGPALAMAGLQLGFMFAGVIVVEQVFSWPGIGAYLADSIPASDFPAIAGVTLVLGAVYVAANAVVDVLQALADPRVGT